MPIIIVIIAIIALLSGSAQAEIVCTNHGGCRETGKRIILGNSGGVTPQQYITSYREAKPRKVRIIRNYYSNE